MPVAGYASSVPRSLRTCHDIQRIYEQNGLGDRLVTTDELNGIRREKVTGVVEDLAGGNLKNTGESEYSRHHYALY